MRSKTHEPVLFERSEFTGECAELPIESRKLSTAARRCGCRAGTARLLFFCRRFLFQIKRKCRNAGSIRNLIVVRRKVRYKFILCRCRGSGASRSPHPTSCTNKVVRISRADDSRPYRILFRYSLLLITLSEAKQTPQSLCDSSPSGAPEYIL